MHGESSTHTEELTTVTISGEYYAKLLRCLTTHQASLPIASLAHQGNSIACTSTCPFTWILNSCTLDYVTGMSTLFSEFQYSNAIQTVTLVNGSTTNVHGVGNIAPPIFSFLILDVICPFVSI